MISARGDICSSESGYRASRIRQTKFTSAGQSVRAEVTRHRDKMRQWKETGCGDVSVRCVYGEYDYKIFRFDP